MGYVGSFGDIDFYCKSVKGKIKALSFHDLSRSSSASFAEHARVGEKAYLEFNADGLDDVSLTIEANARYHVKPLEVEKKLFEKKSAGKAELLVLGGKKVGENPFVITSISENYKVLNTDGRPISIEFQVSYKEYANKTAKVSKKKTVQKVKASSAKGSATKAEPKVKCSETYTVKDGDCLWKIAKKYYGKGAEYTRIYNANKDKIKNPNLIYTGQVLVIPL